MIKITTEDLLSYYSSGFNKQNDDIAASVIRDYEKIIKKHINFFSNEKEFYGIENLCKMLAFKYGNLNSTLHVDYFYAILDYYGYKMKLDIIGAIQRLGNLVDPSHNKDLISVLLNSPYIDDISFNGTNRFTIESAKFGSFEFYLAKEVFKNNKGLISYMEKEVLASNCYANTETVASFYQDLYSITSLCIHYFVGVYYHSYSYDQKTNSIIDLNNNSVMEKVMFDRLYQPIELIRIKNSQISEVCEKVEMETCQPKKRKTLLKIALYYQLQNLTSDEIKKIK